GSLLQRAAALVFLFPQAAADFHEFGNLSQSVEAFMKAFLNNKENQEGKQQCHRRTHQPVLQNSSLTAGPV
ncbi:hypothetical protein, partial [Enterocloster clostridioformis]|uniref:hypothetical protein n=1 Tax=Enterocloster clostridioformis TaxID=1531 RepID=UPI004062E25B